ncbi:fatty acid desaturase family protein [Mycolicibacterium tusciae]|uniref:fatty acid desaturase family protein n=1 Tax=Mycolicibacterium tusciae TaxID=75922 RepID=UPI00031E3756|nr:acyl-CoA desaturase [Mycolicibacterium tusciae]
MISVAIAEVAEYAHLSEADVEALGSSLDEIRRDIEGSLGANDRAYIKRVIRFQRCLEVASRLTIWASRGKAGWMAGTLGLLAAKCIENMELGHNITHGQWDWMNDPEIHSNTWEWDMVSPSSQWRYAHNYRHHVYSNVIGMDDDLGFGVIRVSRDQEWKPGYLWAPLRAVGLSVVFEWGIALHNLAAEQRDQATEEEKAELKRAMFRKMGRQAAKDYLFYPALSGRRFLRTFLANLIAAGFRNGWAYIVIVCGHFVDGAEKFTPETVENETKPEWYLRQMLGTANFDAGPVLRLMSGNLCYQIEHHLFPDLPSNRLPEISARVRALLAEHDLPYTTGPLIRQFWHTVRTICKLSLPDRFLTASSDDAPETASEEKFRDVPMLAQIRVTHEFGTQRRGLATATANRAGQRMKRGRVRPSSRRTAAVAALVSLFTARP